ncbi:2-dehydropantoate 2-reductase [Desertibacillus haloalkaliphilus]|uniref:2-dehydropantoate 2-reductase n=1 Tax=Desertibacillus haloalkaliphilus TaxID=1328930 RepID=UPI001C26B710|nr:2-dehydropantoate 2-reductase [Desertibacillus haloalkaliphilus]MBU8907123.1 2-dehydropantoate 2-reductase [Desertibacillus haloalkaliphilus]
MKIGVIGAGAIGLLIASYLDDCGHRVTVYTKRAEQAERISGVGIRRSVWQMTTTHDVRAVPFSADAVEAEEIVFIALKQYQLAEHREEVEKLTRKVGALVFLQNGMSHLSIVEALSECKVYLGIVEHGALKTSEHEVIHTGAGCLKVGIYRQERKRDRELFTQLTEVGFSTMIQSDWEMIMKQKLVVNAVINPLTALYRVNNGQLMTNTSMKTNMYRLYKEAISVLGIEQIDLWEQVCAVCEQTSTNRSSMLRDIELNRKTEVDAITGYLVKQADDRGLTVPYTRFVYDSIKGLESKQKEARGEER